jgi:hypothetical protein
MSFVISDSLLNVFGTPEVGLTVTAYLASDIGQIPQPFMAPPSNAKVQATATADSSGNFSLTVPTDAPVFLVTQSALNSTTYYWAEGVQTQLGYAAGSVPAGGLTASSASAFGAMGEYTATLTQQTSGKVQIEQLDVYGRQAKGGHSVNLLNHASAADTGVASSGTTTYNNGGGYYDVSMFDELSIKLNITNAAGGSSPTVTLYVDLIDAQGVAYVAFTSDAMVTTAGALTLTRLISLGKSCTVGNSGVIQGASSSLAGCKMQLRIVGGGSTSNTSITYSLVVDGR